MKNLLLFIFFPLLCFGQNMMNSNSLEVAKKAEALFQLGITTHIKSINKNSILQDQATYIGDITNDGIDDIFIWYSYGPKGDMSYASGISFYKTIRSTPVFEANFNPDYRFIIQGIQNSKIFAQAVFYGENDEQGSPSVRVSKKISFIEKKGILGQNFENNNENFEYTDYSLNNIPSQVTGEKHPSFEKKVFDSIIKNYLKAKDENLLKYNSKIYIGDISNDGRDETIVWFTYGKGGSEILGVEAKIFEVINKEIIEIYTYNPGFRFDVEKISWNTLYLNKTLFKKGDLQCCPTDVSSLKLELTDGVLVKKNYTPFYKMILKISLFILFIFIVVRVIKKTKESYISYKKRSAELQEKREKSRKEEKLRLANEKRRQISQEKKNTSTSFGSDLQKQIAGKKYPKNVFIPDLELLQRVPFNYTIIDNPKYIAARFNFIYRDLDDYDKRLEINIPFVKKLKPVYDDDIKHIVIVLKYYEKKNIFFRSLCQPEIKFIEVGSYLFGSLKYKNLISTYSTVVNSEMVELLFGKEFSDNLWFPEKTEEPEVDDYFEEENMYSDNDYFDNDTNFSDDEVEVKLTKIKNKKIEIFWVGNDYRTNRLSLVKGGCTVVTIDKNSKCLGYKNIKNPYAYISMIDHDDLDIAYNPASNSETKYLSDYYNEIYVLKNGYKKLELVWDSTMNITIESALKKYKIAQ